jgi:DNA-binding transcriptional LysR family regulator
MSSALARLRDMFQDELLERIGRTYRLTPAAQAMVEPLQATLQAIQHTLDLSVKFDPSTSKQRFRIAMSDYLLLWLFPRLIERLRQLAPGVRLHAEPVNPEVSALLEARKLDLSIQPAKLVRGVESQALFEDRWVCAVWRGHPSVKGQITRKQLLSLPHAAFLLRRVTLAEQLIAPALGKPPLVHVTTSSFVALPFLLRGTPLVAVIQQKLGEHVQALAEIRLLELPIPSPALAFEMSWNPIATGDPAHAWLRSVIADVAGAC